MKLWALLRFFTGQSETLLVAVFYFLFFGHRGLILIFFPLYCVELGFTPFQIALVGAASTVAMILGASLFQQAAHYLVSARLLLLGALWLSAAAVVPILFVQAFWPIMFAYSASLILLAGAGTLVDALAIRSHEGGIIDFPRVRTWGSIGFIAVALIFGPILDMLGSASVLAALLAIGVTIGLAGHPVARLLRSVPAKKEVERTSVQLTSNQFQPFLYLLLCTLLSWASHGVLYVYLSISLST